MFVHSLLGLKQVCAWFKTFGVHFVNFIVEAIEIDFLFSGKSTKPSSATTFAFANLPVELQHNILAQLDLQNLILCVDVCASWRVIISRILTPFHVWYSWYGNPMNTFHLSTLVRRISLFWTFEERLQLLRDVFVVAFNEDQLDREIMFTHRVLDHFTIHEVAKYLSRLWNLSSIQIPAPTSIDQVMLCLLHLFWCSEKPRARICLFISLSQSRLELLITLRQSIALIPLFDWFRA